MRDVFKVLLFFGVFIGICAFCEWIADNAPWVNWILIPVVVYVVFIATFGNHFNNGKEENK